MSRRICLVFAGFSVLAACRLFAQQDAQPADTGNSSQQIQQLQTENAALKKEVDDAAKTIAQLQAQLAATGWKDSTVSGPAPVSGTNAPPRALPLDATNAAPAAAGAPDGTNTPAGGTAPGGANRSYKVVSGDSLWKISHKMYPGDTKNGIEKIKDANKDTLVEGKPLKIGQVLVIPP
jgi:nucleoid-associated protein YgaU